jgi:Uma2 family endonuclease
MAARPEPLLVTVEQFLALPEREDLQEELHAGAVVTMTRPKPWHIGLQNRIADLLKPLAAGFYVSIELPFRPIAEYELRCADVGVVALARWNQVGDGDLFGVPEVVVEVLSPYNTANKTREYVALCLANGCRDFLTIDRKTRTITVHRVGESAIYTAGQNVPLIALGGQTLTVDEVFADTI